MPPAPWGLKRHCCLRSYRAIERGDLDHVLILEFWVLHDSIDPDLSARHCYSAVPGPQIPGFRCRDHILKLLVEDLIIQANEASGVTDLNGAI